MPPRLPPSLVRNLREKRCMLFAGAGLSAWAGLPTWRKLLEETVEEVRNETLSDDGGELDRMIESGKYLELADHCREQLGRRYTELMSERLRADDVAIPEIHRLVIGLPFAGWITTNYDKLLERAYNEVRGGWPKTLTHADADVLGTALFDRVPFILKAHGDIDRPESIVLTTRDYREIIHGNPAFNATFSAILLTHAVLFVGYSLSDPDFRLLMDRQLTAFRTFVPDRYAIMPDVGEVEREVMWRTARIKVLTYEGDHAWLLEFLRALKEEVGAVEPEAAVEVEPARPAAQRAGGTRRTRTGSRKPKPMPMPAPPAARPATAHPAREAMWDLTFAIAARRIEAHLVDPEGVPVARGTGPEIDWHWIVRLVSRVHTDHGVRPQPIGEGLAAQLPHELLEALARAGAEQQPPMVRLTLDAELEALPWELTDVGGTALAMQVPLVRAPTGITDAARGIPQVRERPRALLIGDPQGAHPAQQLPGARREVERIAGRYAERGFPCTTLLGADATADALLEALQSGTYDVMHFAGHAWYDALEVYLMLADDVRLTSAELRPVLGRNPPALVFFDSHYTSYLPPGTEAVAPQGGGASDLVRTTTGGRTGFTSDMMRSGVGAFIGCFGSPTDAGAAHFAEQVYEELLGGHTVASAVHRARRATAERLENDATPLLYSLSGYGSLTLV